MSTNKLLKILGSNILPQKRHSVIDSYPNELITVKMGRREKLNPAFKKKVDDLKLNTKMTIPMISHHGIYDDHSPL